MSAEEREGVRKDIWRSRPAYFKLHAPRLDLELHAARLERVLCAWTMYDQEIGYVQAINLVASTLLMLLEGDEEAAFCGLLSNP